MISKDMISIIKESKIEDFQDMISTIKENWIDRVAFIEMSEDHLCEITPLIEDHMITLGGLEEDATLSVCNI